MAPRQEDRARQTKWHEQGDREGEVTMAVYKPVRALDRGLTVLGAVNEHDGLRTQQIAEIVGLSRPTVFRLLETLEGLGFATQSPSANTWHPTLKCKLLSSGFLDKAWVGQIAMPAMTRLTQEILWPLDLVTFHKDAMQIRESTHKISPFSFDVGMVGKELPLLFTAGGHAYLGFCPEAEREIILDILRNSNKPEHALAHDCCRVQQILDRTREQGFGSRNEGFREHTHSISYPIFQGERVIAALSVICLKSAVSFGDMIRNFSDPLRLTCEEISAKVTTEGT
jgi:IclR family mhp operon transcriptional activator